MPPGQSHILVLLAHEMHDHSLLGTHVHGAVREGGEVEVGGELAVDARQQVQVELGALALAIVVRGPHDGFVLVEIEADQEAAAAADEPGDLIEQGLG